MHRQVHLVLGFVGIVLAMLNGGVHVPHVVARAIRGQISVVGRRRQANTGSRATEQVAEGVSLNPMVSAAQS